MAILLESLSKVFVPLEYSRLHGYPTLVYLYPLLSEIGNDCSIRVFQQSSVRTSDSMGSSEIWDKYHSCCIGNGKFPIQHSWYLSQISLLPMLFPVNTILAAYTHAVH